MPFGVLHDARKEFRVHLHAEQLVHSLKDADGKAPPKIGAVPMGDGRHSPPPPFFLTTKNIAPGWINPGIQSIAKWKYSVHIGLIRISRHLRIFVGVASWQGGRLRGKRQKHYSCFQPCRVVILPDTESYFSRWCSSLANRLRRSSLQLLFAGREMWVDRYLISPS